NDKDNDGITALALASMYGHKTLVGLLLRHPNIDINAKDCDGNTALTLASNKGHELVVEELLSHPNIDINSIDNDGRSALTLASVNGHETVVRVLLKHPNIDINAKDKYGYSALTLASANGREAVVEELLKHPNIDITDKDNDGNNALMLASRAGHTMVLDKLLNQSKFDINAKNTIGYTPLMLASDKGHETIVEKLLSHPDIDINAKDKNGLTALILASMNEHERVAEKLLKSSNIDINAKDNDGYTALALAASMNGHDRVVEKLLSHPHIDINAKDNIGYTALIEASKKGHETVVEKFLNHPHIDVNAKDKDGYTALAWASREGHEKIFQKLLLHPALKLSPGTREKLTLQLLMQKHLTNQNLSNPGALAFVSFLPDLLLNQPMRYLNSSFLKIEKFFSEYSAQRDFHPNEAELLLMIKHPDLWDRDPQKASALTRCLTSISHFIDIDASLTDETLKTWGDIGFLTHGFRFWRYDTLGGPQSLLAQFGFQPATESRPLNDVFGKGFLYKDQPSGSLVEFRRGYLLITHPEKGTLVIRNSSPVFGRDLLRHPAYYVKTPLTPNELLSFDPRTLTDQDSILYRDHYPNRNNSDSHSAKSLSALTNTLLDLNTRYRKFKLDTEAFENGTFKGHLSPGLPKWVQVLNQLKAQGKPLPDLAFTQPEFPPYQPYFYFDADMNKTDRFPLTPSHLQELNDFVSGQWSDKKYPESDWIRFLNQAGVKNHGELVLLESNS
ncbi:MAG: ankyrin repeat domain-containing protein, partial [Cyanobacteria bacterium]|nr:ankyrin repeat domain-containing protein [Cyanobacteriota bacterium]